MVPNTDSRGNLKVPVQPEFIWEVPVLHSSWFIQVSPGNNIPCIPYYCDFYPFLCEKKSFWICAPPFFLEEHGAMSRTVTHPPPGISPLQAQASLVSLPGTIWQCKLQMVASKYWLFGRKQQQWHKSALFFLITIIITIIASVKGGKFYAYCTSACER